jgi:formate hydrogenlyase subunit 6/NADH:ubiquinone oxidoreductase subunit I
MAMKLVTMFQDVFPSLFRAPITERYPFERRETPDRLRSLLTWDRQQCTGCGMCATDCPSQAIEMVVFDKKAKSIVLGLHVDRCTFCGQCAISCKQGSLTLEHGTWELASLDRGNLMIHLGEARDVQDVLAGITSRPPSPPGDAPSPSEPPPAEGRGALPAPEAAGPLRDPLRDANRDAKRDG